MTSVEQRLGNPDSMIPPKQQIEVNRLFALRVQGDSLSGFIFRSAYKPISAGELAVEALAQEGYRHTVREALSEVWDLVDWGFLRWDADRKIQAKELIIRDR